MRRLTKIRVTTLVVVTAWCGFFFGQHKSGLPVLTIKLAVGAGRNRHGRSRHGLHE